MILISWTLIKLVKKTVGSCQDLVTSLFETEKNNHGAMLYEDLLANKALISTQPARMYSNYVDSVAPDKHVHPCSLCWKLHSDQTARTWPFGVIWIIRSQSGFFTWPMQIASNQNSLRLTCIATCRFVITLFATHLSLRNVRTWWDTYKVDYCFQFYRILIEL